MSVGSSTASLGLSQRVFEHILEAVFALGEGSKAAAHPPGTLGTLIYANDMTQSQEVGTVLLNMRKLRLW